MSGFGFASETGGLGNGEMVGPAMNSTWIAFMTASIRKGLMICGNL